jgi:DNA polymerase-3 subunit alpha
MEAFLKQSFGVITYQDDVMMTAINLGGYSWLEADTLRKAMGKKIPAEMKKQEEMFVKGCMKNGILEKNLALTKVPFCVFLYPNSLIRNMTL